MHVPRGAPFAENRQALRAGLKNLGKPGGIGGGPLANPHLYDSADRVTFKMESGGVVATAA